MQRLTVWVLALTIVGWGATAVQAAEGKAPKQPPEARFSKLDKDGDKKLSIEEFVGKKQDDKKQKAEKRFSRLDKDGDGFLSLDEFKVAGKKKDS